MGRPPPLPRGRLATLDAIELAPSLPWWKRAWGWLVHMQKGVPVILSAIALGTAANVWIHGLVSRSDLDQAVGAAVEKAMTKALIDVNSRTTDLETNVSDLPTWRGETTRAVAALRQELAVTTHTANHAESQIDSFFVQSHRR